MYNEPYTVIRYEEDGDLLWAVIELTNGDRKRVVIRDQNGMKF